MNISHDEDNYCNNCIERLKLHFEHFKRSADEEQKYTSLVCSLGYVTLISIFSFIQKNLIIQHKCIFICCLFISIFPFIINEIWKMYMGIENNKYQNEQWSRNFKGLITLDEMLMNINKKEIEIFSNYERFYYFTFYTSLIFGIIASAILFFESLYLVFKG